MKLIRRILRYVMLLALIVVIGCAYYYRSLIFSEIINTYLDNTVNKVLVWANIVPEQDDSATPEPLEAQEAQETGKDPDCEVQETVAQSTETKIAKCECEIEITNLKSLVETAVEQAIDSEPAQTQTDDQMPELDVVVTPEAQPEELAVEESAVIEEQAGIEESALGADVDQPVGEAPGQTEAEEQLIESESEIEADQAVEGELEEERLDDGLGFEVAPESNAPVSHSELINQARLLHLTGNSSTAIDLYRELARLYPDDPNVVGELGNVHYLEGDWEQASLAYYEAALRLHKLRMTEQVHYLYLVIQGLNPEAADKLRGQLESLNLASRG